MRPFLLPVLIALALLPGTAICAPSLSPPLPEEIVQALAQSGIAADDIGLVVQNLDGDGPALAYGEQRPFNPASVMKLLTTLAALDRLGPAHTFKTAVLTSGDLVDGVLYGDLILRGGGDPSLTQERFWLLLREIQARGIRDIRGDVVFDNRLYAIDPADPAAFDSAPLKPYNADPTPLIVNFNAISLRLEPSPDRLAARTDPASLPVDNLTAIDARAACGDWQDGLRIERAGDRLRLDGTYPLSCGNRSLWLNLMCPPATTATYFHNLWLGLGGTYSGQIRLGDAPESSAPLLEFESQPLAEIVRDINKHSNNVMAKMLFLALGAARHGGPADWDKGERAIREWLAERGLDFPELVLENGSGLSRRERMSAASVTRLLLWAAKSPLYYEFAASLPALGLEGTQKKRMNGSPEAGRAWIKSGSLNGTRNLAGYVQDAAGTRKAVVLFINHARPTKVETLQAAVLRNAMSSSPPCPEQ